MDIPLDDQVQRARQLGLSYLGARDHSVHELRQKLRRKRFSEPVIERVLADLERLNLLDDGALARRWVEARLERPAGARKLAQDLRRKGIAEKIIAGVLEEFSADLDSDAAALRLLQKQQWRYRGLDEHKARRRMFGLLARRGYEAETAARAVARVWEEIQEDEVEGS